MFASTQIRRPSGTPSAAPLTHLHFEPERRRTGSATSEFARTVTFVRRHDDAFRRYREFVPLHLAAECHFESSLDLHIPLSALTTFARLSMPLDFDLFWKNDQEYIDNETAETPFPYGRLEVSVGSAKVLGPLDARREMGRLIARTDRSTHMHGHEVTFDVRGGCGRPVAHFSAASVKLLAQRGASIRLRVRPEAAFDG